MDTKNPAGLLLHSFSVTRIFTAIGFRVKGFRVQGLEILPQMMESQMEKTMEH